MSWIECVRGFFHVGGYPIGKLTTPSSLYWQGDPLGDQKNQSKIFFLLFFFLFLLHFVSAGSRVLGGTHIEETTLHVSGRFVEYYLTSFFLYLSLSLLVPY